MKLAEAQDLFAALVTREGAIDPAWRDACLEGSDELPAAERAHIYADMYVFRLVEAVREDFPLLARILGDDAFFELSRAYVHAHPSRNPSLARLGANLPEFLRSWPAQRPDLADLAALEWARAEAFLAPDAGSVSLETLQQVEGGVPAAWLRLSPSVRLLSLQYDPLILWNELDAGRGALSPRAAPVSILVWRRGFDVFHAGISPEEMRALSVLREGGTLADACEPFAALPDGAQAASEAITSWFGEGLIAAVS